MSHSPGGRESPSSTASSTTASGSGSVIGSVGSGSNGCRNSGASFDSGRATSSTTFQGVRYSAGGLSSESGSLGSFRNSYHSSSSSLGSIPSEEIRNFDIGAMISQGVPDQEILNSWLTGIHLECYYQNFIRSGYDMHTISRMTPEDLNAIGVTKPHHRKKIKSEISQLNISEGLPGYIPESIEEWLRLLKLEEYLPRLIDQGYHNVRQVTNITWEDLDDIGILKLGHQKKFMLAIKRIQDILSGKRMPMAHVPNAYLTTMDSFHMLNQQHQQQQYHHNQLLLLRNQGSPSSAMPYSSNTTNNVSPHSQQSIINSQIENNSSQYHHPSLQQDPRHHHQQHHIQRNLQYPMQQSFPSPPNSSSSSSSSGGISHQIQVHQPPQTISGHDRMQPQNNLQQQQQPVVQPVYHPEVISIRVKNGHANNSLDSPPEEEPIYGSTSSFHPSSSASTTTLLANNSSPMQQPAAKGNNFLKKSYEDGETTPTNGYGSSSSSSNGSNLAMTKQNMSNTWTLPRLQRHKPISKVMGGGTPNTMSNSCDSSVAYPINPGPFAPHQFINMPSSGGGPTPPSISSFGGKGGDYGSLIKNNNGPPPPPRRSSCSSLGGNSQQFDEDNLPLPPPPRPPSDASAAATGNPNTAINNGNAQTASFSSQQQQPGGMMSNSAHPTFFVGGGGEAYNNSKMYHNTANTGGYYINNGQRNSTNYQNHSNNGIIGLRTNKMSNGLGSSTNNSSTPNYSNNSGYLNRSTTLPKSRDPSPGSDVSDPDLPSNNGFLSKGVRRNGSDASFKSNSSTESESIPFANDNAGTIKQQKPANRPSQQQQQSDGDLQQNPNPEAGDVLSDIGSMLADLTDQLDAILEQERTSKH